MAHISVSEAAGRYPLSAKHIRYLVAEGMVKGRKVGNSWAVDEASPAGPFRFSRDYLVVRFEPFGKGQLLAYRNAHDFHGLGAFN